MREFADTFDGIEAAPEGAPIGHVVAIAAFGRIGRVTQQNPARTISLKQFGIGDVRMITSGRVLMQCLVLLARQANQILQAVVISHAVDVMNLRAYGNRAMLRLPYKDMFPHISAIPQEHDITGLPHSPALPTWVSSSSRSRNPSIVAMNEAQGIPDILPALMVGGCGDGGRLAASTFTKASWRCPISRWWRSCASLHLLKGTRLGPMTLNETGTTVRVLPATRRQGKSTSTGAFSHTVSVTH